jgi:chitinase
MNLRRLSKPVYRILGIALLLSSCLSQGTPTFTKLTAAPVIKTVPTLGQATAPSVIETPSSRFRIIGYATMWDSVVDEIQYDKLTHINYAFLLPKPDGTFNYPDQPETLKGIVAEAHAHKVKVLISIGGGGLDGPFEALASDAAKRAVFVRGALNYVSEFELDGVDIDWESPNPGDSAQNYLSLMTELRAALPQDKLLTSAVASHGHSADGIPSEVFALVDFLNIMAYDGSETDHSPYSLAEQALDYWSERGLPKEKTILGVPFYGRPIGVTYRELIQTDLTAADRDVSEYERKKIYYNGLATMQRKTELALERASGIMIWELAFDTTDETSLLGVISRTASKLK